MKKIELCGKYGQGKHAIVDDDDYDFLNQFKWCVDSNGYIRKATWMHREVNRTPVGMDTDHINGNKLDNRKCNLRSCTHGQNVSNVAIRKDNTSGYKGVCWHKGSGKWHAYINIHGVRKHLGSFTGIKEASKAYARASRKYHGKFSRL